MTPDNWKTVGALVAWLDRENGRGDHETALRIMKITEEAGEVAEAYIGTVGQNPRKGRSHTPADVVAELCDVIVTAAVALHSFTVDPQGAVEAKLARIAGRPGVRRPPDEDGEGPVVTTRHLEVLRLAAAGFDSYETAEILGMSRDGVNAALQGAYRALGVHDRAHAVAVALVLGLIGPGEVPVPDRPVAGGREAA
jgi:DNA-binding CsgD family transcriptional regulator/phosphoribosyl-ATP pyrophosphohydrolase